MRINLPPLHQKQLEVRGHPARFKVISAGRRWGKGVLGVGECFKRGIMGQKCRWIPPTYTSDSFQAGWNLAVRYASQIPQVAIHIQRREIDFSGLGGAWLQFRTADEPDNLRGEGIDFAVVDEAAHIGTLEETWEQAMRPSLMDRKGAAWFISTPRGFNYFNTLYKRHQTDPAWASFHYPTNSNPTIDADEIAALRASLPALVARQEIDAEFVQLAGALFKRENVTVIDHEPAGLHWVRSWDLAFTEKTTSDFTAGAKMALDGDGRLVIAHMVHMRAEWPQVVRTIADTARLDGTSVQQGVEVVGAQVGALQTLLRDPLLAGHTLRPIAVDKDKLTRALPLVARSEQGKLAVVRGPWVQSFLDELCAFPESDHDDQVDAVTGGMQLLARSADYFMVAV